MFQQCSLQEDEEDRIPDEPNTQGYLRQIKRVNQNVRKPVYGLDAGPYYYFSSLLQSLSSADSYLSETQRIYK